MAASAVTANDRQSYKERGVRAVLYFLSDCLCLSAALQRCSSRRASQRPSSPDNFRTFLRHSSLSCRVFSAKSSMRWLRLQETSQTTRTRSIHTKRR